MRWQLSVLRGTYGNPDEPAPAVSPEVQAEADSLSISEKRLRRRRIELDIDNVEDAFKLKEGRRIAEQEERRRTEAAGATQLARKKWADTWEKWGLSQFPSDAPAAIKLAAHAEIQRTLGNLRQDQSAVIVGDLVKAAVSKVVAPHR